MARAAAPVAAVAAVALAWVIAAPGTADLAAHSFRAWLWDSEGFTVYNAQWYGGHHVPGYSLLFPPLAWLLGAREAVALSGVAAAAALVMLARSIGGERSEPAAWLLALAAAANLAVGRGPFVLGAALGALALLLRDRAAWSAVPAAACAAASPVAGLFLALIGVSLRAPALVAAPAVLVGSLVLLFPEGGAERFVATAFWPMFAATAAAVWMLPGRTLRTAGTLYLGLLAGAFLIETPVGQNAVRLGALALPAALVLAGRGPKPALIGVGAVLVYLQLLPAVRAVDEAWGDPSTKASFYEPLLDHLAERAAPGDRVEVVFTKNHWEASYVARHYALGRGWERQLDIKVNGVFYDGDPLTIEEYRKWIVREGIDWVAVPDVPLDYSSREEGRVAAELLGPGARLPGWVVYPTHSPRAPLLIAGPTDIVAVTPLAGRLRTGRRYSRYWRVVDGDACPVEGRDGWLELEARAPGLIRVETRFAPFGDGCGPG